MTGRNNLWMAVALVASFAMVAGGCGTTTDDAGAGGNGAGGNGSGGNGNGGNGNGGTGGSDGGAGGGGSLCDAVECAIGELCNDTTGLCGCTTTPNSCSAADPALDCNPVSRHCESSATCTPACGTGERCTLDGGGNAACVCDTAPDSCAAGSTCNANTRRCESDTPNNCVPACRTGEACNDVNGTPICQCDAVNDSCPNGQFCNLNLRCEVAQAAAEEFGDCTTAGTTSGSLECVDTGGGLLWLLPCATSAGCENVITVCLADATGNNFPYCWYNLCDVDSLGSDPQMGLPTNGTFWDSCDDQVGYTADGTGNGSCIPLCGNAACDSQVGVCFAGGASPAGGDCHPDAVRNDDANNCAPGTLCLSNTSTSTTACASDADCAAEASPSYCGLDGICALTGFCGDLCNSGTAGAAAGAGAGCDDPAAAASGCIDISGGGTGDSVMGYCLALCDMFDANACPAYQGIERSCYPFMDDPANPIAGVCIPQQEPPLVLDAECGFDNSLNECEDNALCIDRDVNDPANPSVCSQWCNCPGGFDANDACIGAADCPVDRGCARAQTGNEVIGFCL